MNEVALRYAESLYSLAIDVDKVLIYQQEVKTLKKLIADNKEFLTVLASDFITQEEKEKIIDKTFVGFSIDIVSLLKVICKHHRVNELINILSTFNSLANQYRNVKEGRIYSVTKIDEDTLKRIEKEISKLENVEVELTPFIDPSLIGGVKVVINDHIYDDSISYHLQEMKNKLLRK